MKKHTIYGWKILGGDEDNEMPIAKNIARWHHEKWDGSRYPDGLKGEQIPVEARIVALADSYDAFRFPLPYKKELSHEKVVKIILEGDGSTPPDHFDPEILRLFRKYQRYSMKYIELILPQIGRQIQTTPYNNNIYSMFGNNKH